MSHSRIDDLLRRTYSDPPRLPDDFAAQVVAKSVAVRRKEHRWRYYLLMLWFGMTLLVGGYGMSKVTNSMIMSHWVFLLVSLCTMVVCFGAFLFVLRKSGLHDSIDLLYE